ncbi:transient receptor potential cation channel protein painless [Condylostylus longicornis]|uniref:transient receptor potential cation channel protein painless n=1 Tax=Condylostylus longicornis TaxID=2530218 RepID=UPI00244DF089|nr:transient receptor potential cation channel protein painless [Condylostylus longicornis]XP_055382229.1 transient receptor potential cation channel protein painless [Condylostylus longicornis]
MDKSHTVDMDAFTVCMQDPQVLLSQALEKRNLLDFKIAIDMEADPTKMDSQTNISVFEMALKTYGCSDFVDECIRRGCKCDYINRRTNKAPINYAADSRDPKIMASILSVKNVPVNTKYSNLTPLNSLAKNLTSENYLDVFECIKLLIDYGANPNIPDQREFTPILYIIDNKHLNNINKKEMIKYLLNSCQIDLDTFRDGKARQLLMNQYPDIKLPDENSDTISYDALISYIRNGNEENFINNYNKYLTNSSGDNQQNLRQEENLSLLLEAIQNGQNNAFKLIKETGNCNLNTKRTDKNPLKIACVWGNNEALKELLNDDSVVVSKTDNLLKTIIQKLDEKSYNSFTNYNACFYTLLNSDKIDVNEIDPSGTSALYYAIKYKNEKAINELLQRGAYMGTMSQFNDISITDISPEILENYLDSCVKTNGLKPGDNLFEITINYSNLIPTCKDIKNQTNNTVKCEMTPIEYIAETKELKHLLKHPVITSFLFLKWHRLSLIFYINFLLYSIFCASLVTFIILKFNNTAGDAIVNIFYLLSLVGLVYMILRELLQFIMSPSGFLRSQINYMEIILIILTIVTLSEPNYEKETQRVLAVFTILLATLELCLLVGSLPVLSISTHMLMLRAVSETFLKCFALYSMFVITFSISFYILFGKPGSKGNGTETDNGENGSGNDNENGDEGEFNKFANPFTAIIKTIVMLTGEFDAGDIEFNSFYSYLVFLLFVFFMSIVLFNLLNGLAVSDTQAIKSQAELNGSICRTIILSGYERALSGKDGRTSFIVNHEPFRSICKRLINIFPDLIHGNQISILPNDRNRIMIPIQNSTEMGTFVKVNGVDSALLKKTFANESEREKRLIDPPVKLLPCCCSYITNRCSEMDVRTVKTALAIIEKKEKHKRNESRIQKMEENINRILQILESKNY